MKKLRSILIPLMILFLIHLPRIGVGQDFLNGVCRIEEGRLIFRIDLNWTREQVKQVSGLFDLDSTLLSKALSGQIDSLMLADGWQWKKVNSRTAEISRFLVPEIPPVPHIEKGGILSKLFLMDDSWLHIPGLPEPAEAGYGVNQLVRNDVFTYSDSAARFFLPGYTDAREVFISGTFNDWSTGQAPMKREGEGWAITLVLKPGKYAYKYIVDGRWTSDPNNRAREDDLNGGYNSLVFCYNYRFVLKGHPEARKVILAGSFNGFNPGELIMLRTADGWELPLFLRPGTHAYKFVVDGEWITDPANPVIRPDGRGNFNSFMGIGDTTWFRIEGYQAVKSLILTGSFNAWNTAELSMQKIPGGWQLPYVLAPGNYEYKFIADGRWMTDPANPYRNGEDPYTNSYIAVNPNHTFVLDSFPSAKRVLVTGSFNGWNESGFSMIRKDNRWILPIFLKPGKVNYKFIVDGTWILDPENELWEENEYGTGNSILWIGR